MEGPKQKRPSVVDVSCGESKVQCSKNNRNLEFRSMNQDKLDIIKQEMVRVNINSLGMNEQKWTGRYKFNAGDHYT